MELPQPWMASGRGLHRLPVVVATLVAMMVAVTAAPPPALSKEQKPQVVSHSAGKEHVGQKSVVQ